MDMRPFYITQPNPTQPNPWMDPTGNPCPCLPWSPCGKRFTHACRARHVYTSNIYEPGNAPGQVIFGSLNSVIHYYCYYYFCTLDSKDPEG